MIITGYYRTIINLTIYYNLANLYNFLRTNAFQKSSWLYLLCLVAYAWNLVDALQTLTFFFLFERFYTKNLSHTSTRYLTRRNIRRIWWLKDIWKFLFYFALKDKVGHAYICSFIIWRESWVLGVLLYVLRYVCTKSIWHIGWQIISWKRNP